METPDSLAKAIHGLLGSFGHTADMAAIEGVVAGSNLADAWSLVNKHDQTVRAVELGGFGTWPTTNYAIIRFEYQPQDEPYLGEGDDRVANIKTVFCLVDNAADHLILDPTDGSTISANIYGSPVEWCSYEEITPEEAEKAAPNPLQIYKVLGGGENVWQIARKLNIGLTGQDIMDHNDLDDAEVAAGTELHLPIALPETEKKAQVELEILPEGRPMHVIRDGGTRKYTFGNARKWEDIRETGPRQAQDKNLLIFAIAHVPIGNETAAYYMESGDFDPLTKKIKWTIGYNHTHLADGHVEPKAAENPQVKEIIQQKLDEAAERKAQLDADQLAKKAAAAERLAMIDDVNAEDNPPSKRMGSDSLPDEKDMTLEVNNPHNWWKTTFKPLNEERRAEVYMFNMDIVVGDLENKMKNKWLRRLDGVKIAGTFTGPDHREYWRPKDSMDLFTWYGIPVFDPETGDPVLTAEADVFNTDLPLSERVTMRHGRLSRVERYFTVPLAKATARSPWLRRYADKVKQNKE